MFSPATMHWFTQRFAAATPAQEQGWPVIASGAHTLITAPTGSGKSLAAFLVGIDRCLTLASDAPAGVRVLYLSPLKALVYDVERNLRAPLEGIGAAAQQLDLALRPISVAMRTGDTPNRERQRQLRQPSEILATTPESLFLLLGSQARATLRYVHTIIVDELHALLPTKRGAHLALSLERLCQWTVSEPQRIGLSATVQPLTEAAGFLGGERPVTVVDAAAPPRLQLTVSVPVPEMERVAPPAGGEPAAERGIWQALYPALLADIRRHRSTIVFVNSRGLCERLTARLNELAGEPLVQAHHGSVSHARRSEIETALKGGELRAIVATSSLELGIDMGAVDQVLLVESPGSVARGLQRIGRAGHGVGELSTGRLYPKFRGDLVECAVVAQRMLAGSIEATLSPRNPLDVLAQQLVALCLDTAQRPQTIATLVRRAWPYRQLTDAALQGVLEMLCGSYPSGDLAELRPLLTWDRSTDQITPRRGAELTVRLNGGTIPDRGLYSVQLGAGGPKLGELDEEMVFESKAGDVILLGASGWRIEAIERDRVLVSAAPGEPGRLPFWHGEGPGRPLALGRAIGAFLRQLEGIAEGAQWLAEHYPLDPNACTNLAAYVAEQRAATGRLPSDEVVVVEQFRDELGDLRVCILTPLGARIHAPWAMALKARLAERAGFHPEVMYSDDGLVLRLPDLEHLPANELLLPEPEEVEQLVLAELPNTPLFASLFRENAARALLMPRGDARGRRPLWAQRLKAAQLLATVRRYPNFPIVLETFRQALAERFDLNGLRELLIALREGRMTLHSVETRGPSPFARSLVFAYVAAYLYEQDTPLAERRAQALTLDSRLLAELLGAAELRALVDPQALTELEQALQYTAAAQQVADADRLHDLLRRLGDLSAAEISARSSAPGLLDRLLQQRRAVAIQLAGEPRYIAAEDAGLYRDALGIAPPDGLAASHLAPVEGALVALLRRYARVHGPFPTQQPAIRFGLPAAQLEPALLLLRHEGQLVQGEIRPEGVVPEWCDQEVLRRLRRLTLARARHEVAALPPRTLGRFLPQWHGIGARRAVVDNEAALVAALDRLVGLPLPWSALATELLPLRLPGFRFEALDLLAASGRLVWWGAGRLGARDGRVVLAWRDEIGLWPAYSTVPSGDPLAQQLMELLGQRGACFLVELELALRQGGVTPTPAELLQALWELVWSGQVTNDTFTPLRAFALGSATRPRRRGPSASGGRWSRVVPPGLDAHPTERLLATAQRLLRRYGVVCRAVVQAEGIEGGFSTLYPVLKGLEERGQIRRGFFVEGLEGAQFALPEAVERLRAARPEGPPAAGWTVADALLLPAIDPANPWGALLPWPPSGAGQPRRVAGAWLVLVDGAPLAWLGADGKQLLTFPSGWAEEPSALNAALSALARLPASQGRRRFVIERIDGVAALQSPLMAALLAAGFGRDYKGLAAHG